MFEVLPQGDATSGTDNSVTWHLQKMMVPQAWEIWQETSNVILAVLDDGIDYNHVALRDNIWLNPEETPGDGQDNDGNGFIDDVRGWDFFDMKSNEDAGGDADPSPENGSQHGTLVAGVAAARLDTSTGVGGVAGYSKILPLRVTGLDPTSTKNTTRARFIGRAIDYALSAQGSDEVPLIINFSFSLDWKEDGTELIETSCVKNAVGRAYDRNALIVYAAGNEAQRDANLWPGEMVVVAATDERDGRWERTSNASNYGLGVDIAAPGSNILTTGRDNQFLICVGYKSCVAERCWRRGLDLVLLV